MALLQHEKTGMRNFREPCMQWQRKFLHSRLEGDLEACVPTQEALVAATAAVRERSLAMLFEEPPLPLPEPGSSVALSALESTALGYCSPLGDFLQKRRAAGAGAREAPQIISAHAEDLAQGMYRLPQRGSAGGIPDIFHDYYETPRAADDDDDPIEVIEAPRPVRGAAIDVEAPGSSRKRPRSPDTVELL